MDQEMRDLGENMKEMSSLLKKLTRTVEANTRIERMDKHIQTEEGNEPNGFLTEKDDNENKEEDDGENISYIYENIPLRLVSKEDL